MTNLFCNRDRNKQTYICTNVCWVSVCAEGVSYTIRHISAVTYCTLYSLNNHHGVCYKNLQNTETYLLNLQTPVIHKPTLCSLSNANIPRLSSGYRLRRNEVRKNTEK